MKSAGGEERKSAGVVAFAGNAAEVFFEGFGFPEIVGFAAGFASRRACQEGEGLAGEEGAGDAGRNAETETAVANGVDQRDLRTQFRRAAREFKTGPDGQGTGVRGKAR